LGSSARRALLSKTEMCSNFETSVDTPTERASFSLEESLYEDQSRFGDPRGVWASPAGIGNRYFPNRSGVPYQHPSSFRKPGRQNLYYSFRRPTQPRSRGQRKRHTARETGSHGVRGYAGSRNKRNERKTPATGRQLGNQFERHGNGCCSTPAGCQHIVDRSMKLGSLAGSY